MGDNLKPHGLGRPSYLHVGVPPAQTVSLLLHKHRYVQIGALLTFTVLDGHSMVRAANDLLHTPRRIKLRKGDVENGIFKGDYGY